MFGQTNIGARLMAYPKHIHQRNEHIEGKATSENSNNSSKMVTVAN